MPNFHNDKHTNHTSTTENGIYFNGNEQHGIDSVERMRRLIPYMTFYIPTSNRVINKPMVIQNENWISTAVEVNRNIETNSEIAYRTSNKRKKRFRLQQHHFYIHLFLTPFVIWYKLWAKPKYFLEQNRKRNRNQFYYFPKLPISWSELSLAFHYYYEFDEKLANVLVLFHSKLSSVVSS